MLGNQIPVRYDVVTHDNDNQLLTGISKEAPLLRMEKNNTTATQGPTLEAQQRYALRKLSVGTVSVLVGLTFFGTRVTAQAATTEPATTAAPALPAVQAERGVTSAANPAEAGAAPGTAVVLTAQQPAAPVGQVAPADAPTLAATDQPTGTPAQPESQPERSTTLADAEAWLQVPVLDQWATSAPQFREQLATLKHAEYDNAFQRRKHQFQRELRERLRDVPQTESLQETFNQATDLTRLQALFTELSDKGDAYRRDITERKVQAIKAQAQAAIKKSHPQEIRRLADVAVQRVELTRAAGQVEALSSQIKAATAQLAGYRFLDAGAREPLQSALNRWRGQLAQFTQRINQLLDSAELLPAANPLIREVRQAVDPIHELVAAVDQAHQADLKATRAAALAALPQLDNLVAAAPALRGPIVAALEAELNTPTQQVDRLAILMGIAERLDLSAVATPAPAPAAPEAQPHQPAVPADGGKPQTESTPGEPAAPTPLNEVEAQPGPMTPGAASPTAPAPMDSVPALREPLAGPTEVPLQSPRQSPATPSLAPTSPQSSALVVAEAGAADPQPEMVKQMNVERKPGMPARQPMAAQSAARQLPQTGDQEASPVAVLGLALAGILGGTGLIRRRNS